MSAQEKNPAPVAAGGGAKSHTQKAFAADSTSWQRWAIKVHAKRPSARQRRAVRLMVTRVAATPEHAFRTLDARV